MLLFLILFQKWMNELKDSDGEDEEMNEVFWVGVLLMMKIMKKRMEGEGKR